LNHGEGVPLKDTLWFPPIIAGGRRDVQSGRIEFLRRTGDINFENPQFAGHWAGDEVYLVGDYDESNLYETAQSQYHNISKELATEYNQFIEIQEC
jgi:hypothetical protein